MLANSPIRLVIADDSPVFRKGLVHSLNLEKQHSIHIVGEGHNGESLLKEVERKQPDIALTDLKMPLMDGFEASRIINKNFPSTSVIALSFFSDEESIYQMFETGAKGYLTKNADVAEIIEAVKTVHGGNMYYCSSSSVSLIKKIGPSKYNHYKKNTAIRFTEREIQLIRLISFQLTTKEIAGKMKISTRTVEEYSRNIKEKIDAKNTVGIALYAYKNNIVSASEI
ncbi:MAG: response regulator transcription factor [Flavisolibacter sp.]|nr:response regulator transcription factor [Flavisolibacter sp.]